MNRRLLLVLALLAAAALLGTGVGQLLRARKVVEEPEEFPAHWTTGAPPIRMRMETWDIGTTAGGKEIRRSIEIANATEEAWTLRQLRATCDCATATLSAKAVPPGRSASLEIVYRAPAKSGPVAGHVMVEFAEPTSPIVQVNLSAIVAAEKQEAKRP